MKEILFMGKRKASDYQQIEYKWLLEQILLFGDAFFIGSRVFACIFLKYAGKMALIWKAGKIGDLR